MSNKTLGPWTVELHSSNPDKWNVVDEQGDMVSGYLPIEHARLIAARPELLEVLKELEDAQIACWINHYGENPEGSPVPQHIQRARALIAKIEGDAP